MSVLLTLKNANLENRHGRGSLRLAAKLLLVFVLWVVWLASSVWCNDAARSQEARTREVPARKVPVPAPPTRDQDDGTAKAVAELTARLGRVNEGHQTLLEERKRLFERGKKLQDTWLEAESDMKSFIAFSNIYRAQMASALGDMSAMSTQIRSLDRHHLSKTPAGLQFYQEREAVYEIRARQVSVLFKEVERLNKVSGPLAAKRLMDLVTDLRDVNELMKKIDEKMYKEVAEYWYFIDVLGRRSRAEMNACDEIISEYVKNDPNNYCALLTRAGVCWHLGRRDAAISDFTRVIDAEGPEAAIALALRGLLRSTTGDTRGSLQDFAQATKMSPADPRINLVRALTFCGEGRFVTAVTELEKGFRNRGAEADIHCVLAWIYSGTSTDKSAPKKAEENAQRACTLTKSQDWLALASLAAAQAAADDYPAAKKTFDDAASLAVGDCRERCLSYLDRCDAKEPIHLDWHKMLGYKKK